jgi:hypothetical protein
MATLTTDHGTFQAETERECLAMARKAKREAQKTGIVCRLGIRPLARGALDTHFHRKGNYHV